MTKPCLVVTCDTSQVSRGYCNKHYLKLLRYGDPEIASQYRYNTPELFWSKAVRVGDCLIWQGRLDDKGYGRWRCDGQEMRAHQYAFTNSHGPIPQGMEVDHRCRVRACVDPNHLRIATSKQNSENLSRHSDRSVSGHRGVYWNKTTNSWRVQVMHNRQGHFGGYMPMYEVHVAAYKAAELRDTLFTHNTQDKETKLDAAK